MLATEDAEHDICLFLHLTDVLTALCAHASVARDNVSSSVQTVATVTANPLNRDVPTVDDLASLSNKISKVVTLSDVKNLVANNTTVVEIDGVLRVRVNVNPVELRVLVLNDSPKDTLKLRNVDVPELADTHAVVSVLTVGAPSPCADGTFVTTGSVRTDEQRPALTPLCRCRSGECLKECSSLSRVTQLKERNFRVKLLSLNSDDVRESTSDDKQLLIRSNVVVLDVLDNVDELLNDRTTVGGEYRALVTDKVSPVGSTLTHLAKQNNLRGSHLDHLLFSIN
jgi:hypothetical protein